MIMLDHRVISVEADHIKKTSTESVSAQLDQTIHDIAKTSRLPGQDATDVLLEEPMTIGVMSLNGLFPDAVRKEANRRSPQEHNLDISLYLRKQSPFRLAA